MPHPQSATRVRSADTVRPASVLVIDDEYLLGHTLQMTLTEHRVIVESDAAAALRRIENGERFDLVLCDLMMPGMDGIELHRRLSLTLPEEANRIVFFSEGAQTGRVEAFLRRAPNLLIEKPFDIDSLRALIERRVRGSAHPDARPRARSS